MTVHWVYPYGDRISCPEAIGRNVALRLRRWGHRVIHYKWDDVRRIKPGPDDVLIGHPHYNPFTVFRRSVGLPGWRRKIAIFPFAHGLAGYAAFADKAVRQSDVVLAICGRYWTQTAPQSIYAHWAPKLVQLDLAIDRNDFPVVKRQFNPPGKRRVLYIGHTATYKNPKFLSQIALAMPDVEFSWAGVSFNRMQEIPGFKKLGGFNFGSEKGREVAAAHDILLTVGVSDPNPTTVLEAMAWGLVPVCTPQSGYVDYPSIPNVPATDLAGAVAVLRRVLDAPESELEGMRQANWRMLDEHFNWDRFAQQVREAIESDARPGMGRESVGTWARLRGAAMVADTSPWRMRHLSRFVYRAMTGRSKSDRTVLEPMG